MEQLKSFPFALVFVIYAGYLGFQFWEFNFSPDGQVETHRINVEASEREIAQLKTKLNEGKKFLDSIDEKKKIIRGQIQKLSEFQGTLSEALNIPSMIRLLITEAKKLDLRVDRVEPGRDLQKKYYLEQEFKLEVQGTYQQIALFSQRVAQLQRILRIETFNIKPILSNKGRPTRLLNAQLSVRAYQYTIGAEDKISLTGVNR